MKNNYLSFDDRKKLESLYNSGESTNDIARNMNVHLSTVYRELSRGSTNKMDANGRIGYSADIAQRVFCESLKQRGHKTSPTKMEQ